MSLLVLLQRFVGRTESAETMRKFMEEEYKTWIYCPDDVILAINEMKKLVVKSKDKKPDPEEGRKVQNRVYRNIFMCISYLGFEMHLG